MTHLFLNCKNNTICVIKHVKHEIFYLTVCREKHIPAPVNIRGRGIEVSSGVNSYCGGGGYEKESRKNSTGYIKKSKTKNLLRKVFSDLQSVTEMVNYLCYKKIVLS